MRNIIIHLHVQMDSTQAIHMRQLYTVYPTHFICCIVALFIGSTWSIEERRLLVSAERCDGM